MLCLWLVGPHGSCLQDVPVEELKKKWGPFLIALSRRSTDTVASLWLKVDDDGEVGKKETSAKDGNSIALQESKPLVGVIQ